MTIEKLYKEIKEHFEQCESNDAARGLAEDLCLHIEECSDEFTSGHCEESGMLIDECDCLDCENCREDIKADMAYDAMKVGEY